MLIYLQIIETEEDSQKFIAIYEEYKNLLFFIANEQFENEADAEDMVHHVFVKVAENIDIIEPVGERTKQLLVTILNNKITDYYRVSNRHPLEELDEDEYFGVSDIADEEGLLAECILTLPEKQRSILWLKYNDGYSLEEISKLLSMTIHAVRKSEQRARQTLKEMYMEKHYGR